MEMSRREMEENGEKWGEMERNGEKWREMDKGESTSGVPEWPGASWRSRLAGRDLGVQI